jgi:hypothetical protein
MRLDTSGAVEQLVRLGFSRENADRQVRAQLGLSRPSDPEQRTRKSDAMNKTERRRWVELEAMKRAGVIRDCKYNAVTLLLADRCRYTPDFLVEHADGRLELEETKGFWRDDARVKIKVAARLYPMFTFTALRLRKQRDGGGWVKEAF